jgi:Outer membrane protein beta-barrel domain
MDRKMVFLLIATVVVLALCREAGAKEGFYAGLGTAYNTINGDFKGDGGLQGGSEVIILPKINNAFGIDILGGYGLNDQWAIELNLMSSGHSGSWTGLTEDVRYTSFSINGKYSFSSPDKCITIVEWFVPGYSKRLSYHHAVEEIGRTV